MTCERCGGAGWRQVDEAYAVRVVPDLTLDDVGHLDAVGIEAVEKDHARRRSAAANTSLPCNVCNGALYDRWHDGHLDPDHVRAGCAICADADSSTGKGAGHGRRRRRESGPSTNEGAPISEPVVYQEQF